MGLTRRAFGVGSALAAATSGIGTASARGRGRFPWPDGKRAAVSLAYDDGLDSQLENVIPELDAFGLKATFFLTKENMETRLADWVAVAGKGHEIGDHTVHHPCRLKSYSADSFAAEEIAPMERFLDENFGARRPRTYAYPCGFTGLGRGDVGERWRRYRSVVAPTFLAARTVDGDPNDPRKALTNRYLLNAFEPTYDHDDPRFAGAYVRKAMARGGWAILNFHEVLEARKGEGDTSKDVHHIILAWLVSQPVWCAPIGEVFDYVAALDPDRLRSNRPKP